MKRKYIFSKKIPIEYALKKYVVNAPEEDHSERSPVRKTLHKRVQTSTNLKLQIKPTCGI